MLMPVPNRQSKLLNTDIIARYLNLMKINEFLAANFITNLVYDHDILIPVDTLEEEYY
jgi:hypothetical protein